MIANSGGSSASLRSAIRLACALLAILAGHAGAQDPSPKQTAPPASGDYEKVLNDLHAYIGRVYPCFGLKGIDWNQVGRELLPRAGTVRTEKEFGLLVLELVARMEDTHAVVLPGTARPPEPDLPRYDPGACCLIDDRGRPVIYAVWNGSPAARAGLRPGMVVVSVDGVPAADVLKAHMGRLRKYYGFSSERVLRYTAARMLLACQKSGERVRIELEDPNGRTLGVMLAASLGPRYQPRLPVPRRGIGDSADVSWTMLDGGIGYIYVRRIRQGLEGSLDRAVTSLQEARGLIIDVRGNSGGGFDTSTAFVNFEKPPAGAGDGNRPRYTGPIALLTDEACVSAGEGWASWFIANKRARVFGTATTGASARKNTYTLTNGLYRVVVPVKAYTGFLDRPIERRGLEPDVEVRCKAADLAGRKDTVVEAAAAWLKSSPPLGRP